jgi:hypothetical protein
MSRVECTTPQALLGHPSEGWSAVASGVGKPSRYVCALVPPPDGAINPRRLATASCTMSPTLAPSSSINTFTVSITSASVVWIVCPRPMEAPASAAAGLGVKEGDTVCIESRFGGKTQGKVHLSEFMHPKCVGIPGNFGRRTAYMNPVKNTGVHFNSLLSVEESTINPISTSLESSPQVKIYKI